MRAASGFQPYVPQLHRPDTPSLGLGVRRLCVRNVGPFQQLDWRPDPRVNLIESPPGSGCTTLCDLLVRASFPDAAAQGVTADTVGPRASDVPRRPLRSWQTGDGAGAEVLNQISAALLVAHVWHSVIIDAEMMAALDDRLIQELTAATPTCVAQLFLFAGPSVYSRLSSMSAARWRLTSALAGAQLTPAR